MKRLHIVCNGAKAFGSLILDPPHFLQYFVVGRGWVKILHGIPPTMSSGLAITGGA